MPGGGAPPGEGELSAESQAAIENLVEAIASLEQASTQWEDFSERLIDAGEFHTSAGGFKIVDEDEGPEQSNIGLQDFEALMGQQFSGMSPRTHHTKVVAEQKAAAGGLTKDWEPPRKPNPRLSHVSLRAEDAIEVPASVSRTPRPSTAAERGIAVEDQYEANIRQPMPRASTSRGGDGGGGPRKSHSRGGGADDVGLNGGTARQNETARVEAEGRLFTHGFAQLKA